MKIELGAQETSGYLFSCNYCKKKLIANLISILQAKIEMTLIQIERKIEQSDSKKKSEGFSRIS